MGKRVLVTGGSGFIGKHLIDLLINNGYAVLNIDLKVDSNSKCEFQKVDIRESLDHIFESFAPNLVINLAAETSVKPKHLREFTTNIAGVQNLVLTANRFNVEKIIFFSTQYVYQGYVTWKGYNVYKPFTTYGESKKIGEEIVKDKCTKPYLILRPTNIWGEGNEVYSRGLFNVMQKGYYFHPKAKEILRSYGYVKNICHQTLLLLESNESNKVFYLSDEPIELYDWVSKLQQSINGKRVRTLPILLFKCAAFIGDLLKVLGLNFPMNSVRLTNMINSNPIPISDTLRVTGSNPVSLDEAVVNTINWFKAKASS